jgi:hypothetical protein
MGRQQVEAVFLIVLLLSSEAIRIVDEADAGNGSEASGDNHAPSAYGQSSGLLEEVGCTSSRQLVSIQANASKSKTKFAPLVVVSGLQLLGAAGTAASSAGAALQLFAMRTAFANPQLLRMALTTPGLRGIAMQVAPKLPFVGGIGARGALAVSKFLVSKPGFTAKLLGSPIGGFGSGMLMRLVSFAPKLGGVAGVAAKAGGIKFFGARVMGTVTKFVPKGRIFGIFAKQGATVAATGGSKLAIASVLTKVVPILNVVSWGFTAYQIYGLVQTVRAAQAAGAAAEAARLAAEAATTQRNRMILAGGVTVGVVSVLAVTGVIMARKGVFGMWKTKDDVGAFCAKSEWVVDPSLSGGRNANTSAHLDDDDRPGMPQCFGLQWVKIPDVCEPTDFLCHRTACEQVCCETSKCSLYQFRMSEPRYCWLSTDPKYNVDEGCQKKDRGRIGRMWHGVTQDEWYGGLFTGGEDGQNGCPNGKWLCPSSMECVPSCADCDGYSAADSSADDGVGHRCRRAPEQAVCDAASWAEVYVEPKYKDVWAPTWDPIARKNVFPLDKHQCTGLILVKVGISEDTYSSEHDICQQTCCSDPDCILYQLDARHAEAPMVKTGTTVRCWLGKVDPSFNPLFKCRKEQSSGWTATSWAGRYLTSRGCPQGRYSCANSDVCVACCRSQCAGSPESNDANGRCEPKGGMQEVANLNMTQMRMDEKERDEEAHKLLEKADKAKAERDKANHEEATQVVTGIIDLAAAGSDDPFRNFGSLVENTRRVSSTLFITDAGAVANSYFLAKGKPEDDENEEHDSTVESMIAEVPMILDQMKDFILSPKSDSSVCSLLKNQCRCLPEAGDGVSLPLAGEKNAWQTMMFLNEGSWKCSCMADDDCEANKDDDTCTCYFKRRGPAPTCDNWFYEGGRHLVPILDNQQCSGMALVAGCKCDESTCTFDMLSELPVVKLFENDLTALDLQALEHQEEEEETTAPKDDKKETTTENDDKEETTTENEASDATDEPKGNGYIVKLDDIDIDGFGRLDPNDDSEDDKGKSYEVDDKAPEEIRNAGKALAKAANEQKSKDKSGKQIDLDDKQIGKVIYTACTGGEEEKWKWKDGKSEMVARCQEKAREDGRLVETVDVSECKDACCLDSCRIFANRIPSCVMQCVKGNK